MGHDYLGLYDIHVIDQLLRGAFNTPRDGVSIAVVGMWEHLLAQVCSLRAQRGVLS